MNWVVQGLNPDSLKILSILQNVQTGFGVLLASYSVGANVICQSYSSRVVKLTFQLSFEVKNNSQCRPSCPVQVVFYLFTDCNITGGGSK
jgi:hypothetical protein